MNFDPHDYARHLCEGQLREAFVHAEREASIGAAVKIAHGIASLAKHDHAGAANAFAEADDLAELARELRWFRVEQWADIDRWADDGGVST